MKAFFVFLILCFISVIHVTAQETASISFKKQKDTLNRKDVDSYYPITINITDVKINKDSLALYVINVKPDDERSSIAPNGYKLNFNSISLDKISPSYTFYLVIKADSMADRDRTLNLTIETKKRGKTFDINSAKENINVGILIRGSRAINKYNYLAYVGTNFDMVDGVKAKDLFFATNIYVAPQHKGQGFGFNMLLYGNRTLSTTDTSGNYRYTSKIVGIGGDSARLYTSKALKVSTRVSDNLGASFSPLIRIGEVSDPERVTQVFYAPQFEFIWRRVKVTTEYKNSVIVDSTDRAHRPITGTIDLTPQKQVLSYNIYDVYAGLIGFSLKHENSDISIKVQASTGVNYRYTPKSGTVQTLLFTQFDKKVNLFCYIRAWITEPTSGITFGAEVSNNIILKNSSQPYYNVTLSKAINLNALGKIFQPVTSR
jgi:hypothetical protein